MRKFKHWTLLTFIILVFAAILSVFIMWNEMSNKNNKSTTEVYHDIENMYGGEIVSFENDGKQYNIELSKNGAKYHIVVRAKDGKIKKMQRTDLDALEQSDLLSKREINRIITKNYGGSIVSKLLSTWQDTTVYQVQVTNHNKKLHVIVDAVTGDILSETSANAKKENSTISKKEAQKIAKHKLNGIIKKTSYFETSSGGYYLVEIEEKGHMVIIQIHAVSGEIMSVTNS